MGFKLTIPMTRVIKDGESDQFSEGGVSWIYTHQGTEHVYSGVALEAPIRKGLKVEFEFSTAPWMPARFLLPVNTTADATLRIAAPDGEVTLDPKGPHALTLTGWDVTRGTMGSGKGVVSLLVLQGHGNGVLRIPISAKSDDLSPILVQEWNGRHFAIILTLYVLLLLASFEVAFAGMLLVPAVASLVPGELILGVLLALMAASGVPRLSSLPLLRWIRLAAGRCAGRPGRSVPALLIAVAGMGALEYEPFRWEWMRGRYTGEIRDYLESGGGSDEPLRRAFFLLPDRIEAPLLMTRAADLMRNGEARGAYAFDICFTDERTRWPGGTVTGKRPVLERIAIRKEGPQWRDPAVWYCGFLLEAVRENSRRQEAPMEIEALDAVLSILDGRIRSLGPRSPDDTDEVKEMRFTRSVMAMERWLVGIQDRKGPPGESVLEAGRALAGELRALVDGGGTAVLAYDYYQEALDKLAQFAFEAGDPGDAARRFREVLEHRLKQVGSVRARWSRPPEKLMIYYLVRIRGDRKRAEELAKTSPQVRNALRYADNEVLWKDLVRILGDPTFAPMSDRKEWRRGTVLGEESDAYIRSSLESGW